MTDNFTSSCPALDYDYRAVNAMDSPFEVVSQARNSCPVAHTDAYDGHWILFRHSDVAAAAKDTQRFSSAHGVTIPHHGFPIELPPIEWDPPRHTQFRGPLITSFGPRAMRLLEPSIRQSVRDLMADFVEAGEADLVEQLTILLPGIAITRLLNIPDEDRARFTGYTKRLFRDGEDMEAVGAALEHAAEIYADRRANPQDDIPTLMLSLECDGQPISDGEYVCLLLTVVLAGIDTTANAAANILELLALQPDIRTDLINDPSLIHRSIDELLRFVTPLPALSRTTTEEVELGGVTIDAGQRVLLNWMSANHDPEAFSQPDSIDLHRKNISHVAFGTGAHRCLGQHLARLELWVMLQEILRVIPDYKIDHSRIERFSGLTRGIGSLPVTFTPRSLDYLYEKPA